MEKEIRKRKGGKRNMIACRGEIKAKSKVK
jgi:hypothetical protein